MKTESLSGQIFGRLKVLAFSHIDRHGRMMWSCICSCGEPFITAGIQLRKGSAKSCGCLLSETAKAVSTTHGWHGTPTYRSWSSMRQRCLNPKIHNYTDYGGRGVNICERWTSFSLFLADMGPRPEGASLDRFPDVNGNYEPENCRWATSQQQTDNRRKIGNLMKFSTEELQMELTRRVAQ